MLPENDRALKEWAVVCHALQTGRQILLLRKGGIHEENGVFRVDDPEFFLMPTFEHQDKDLLKPEAVPELERVRAAEYSPNFVTLSNYALVHYVTAAASDEALQKLAPYHIWNDRYIRMRLDYNPYDPLYVILLRVYRLPEPITLPMLNRYGGCKSWVTLERPLPTGGAEPVLDDREFDHRTTEVQRILEG